MPRSRWGQAILAVYLGGYVYFLIDAGRYAWPHLTFPDWWAFMGWQAMALSFWPLHLLLNLFGVDL